MPFFKERQITYTPLIGVMSKVDIEKAFDHVNWDSQTDGLWCEVVKMDWTLYQNSQVPDSGKWRTYWFFPS